MGLYTLHCDRCDETTTHEKLFTGEEHEHAIEHPKYDCTVLCRQCEAGRSKAALPEGENIFWVKAKVYTGTSIRVNPAFIPDGESLEEYIEMKLKQERGAIAREIADGIQEDDIEMHGLPESEDLSGFPPNY